MQRGGKAVARLRVPSMPHPRISVSGDFTMKITQSTLLSVFGALVLLGVSSLSAAAQDIHSHTMAPEQDVTAKQRDQASALIKLVRQHTSRFQDVTVAEREGYALQFGCVSGSDVGAMGLHYINGDLVGSGVIDATRPQAIIYEPTPNGGKRLIGVDYLVLVDTWNSDPKHTGPPELMGQLFHLFD